jgi:transcriptional regulator with PAS, ATPase and Fis domain
VGLVDITGPWEAHQPQVLVAARAIACAIEERLRSAQVVRDQVIAYAFHAEQHGGDALIGVDAHGRILSLNDAARRRLGLEGSELPAAVREVLDGALQQRIRRGESAEISLEWPGGAGKPRVVVSPVVYEGRAVGALLRAIAPAVAGRGGARAPARARASSGARYGFDLLLGESDSLREAVDLARVAARNDLPVILCGESGTGKELFAHAIHGASRRVDAPFIAVNCGCIPAALAEAELFGYEAGTFTGGRREGNAGKFEEADGGTLFLDEVSELSPQAQTALLRVLQEREVVRLGGSTPRRVDVRIVAASNKSLPEEIRAGRFRQDLYFRLNVLSVPVPPLRERRGDVGLLARVLLHEAEEQVGRTGLGLADDAVAALEAYRWPGNVRELKNVMLRVAANARGPLIEAADLPAEVRGDAPMPVFPRAVQPARLPELARPAPAQDDTELRQLVQALDASSWNVVRAAQALGVSRMTLYRRMQKHGVERSAAGS